MRSLRTLAAFCLALTVLTGCFTGQRPSFAPTDPSIADPAIAAVVARLDNLGIAPFTAEYSILTKFGNVAHTATVVQVDQSQRAVTIGITRFIFGPNGPETCDLALRTCATGINEAAVSDKSLTSSFYSGSAAARIRQDALTTIGNATATDLDLAGQPATCARLDFTQGANLYCALANGLLALQDTADLRIELIRFMDSADPTAVVTPTTIAGG